jgi:hypothetical protein
MNKNTIINVDFGTTYDRLKQAKAEALLSGGNLVYAEFIRAATEEKLDALGVDAKTATATSAIKYNPDPRVHKLIKTACRNSGKPLSQVLDELVLVGAQAEGASL